ncbi:GHKL domain-containing protein [Chitinophaga silvisoli]|uniref:GHKL domain-containing protein n=2 Tax=Chitinophaga silvisoli TaxID=2291814 RepID=A0A3E1NT98_9BACT|nr:GHKL domain-containing protein [Chitinophaga silvisoli]
MMPRWFYKYKLYHIPFWMFYQFIWWTVAVGNPIKAAGIIFTTTMFPKYFTYVFWETLGVWFNLYFLLPRYFEKGKYTTYVLLLVATTLITACCIVPGYYLTASLAGTTVKELFHTDSFLSIVLANSLPSAIAAMTLAMSIKMGRSWLQTKNKEQMLEKEKLETELNYLKYQFNPHFLFNTINSIFFLIHKNPDMASASLAKFSDLLRHQLYECNDKQILLNKEIAYLENGIELERLRQNTNVEVDIQLPALYDARLGIAPFILMTFVENAFKHVSRQADQTNWVQIELQVAGQELRFLVANSVSVEEEAGEEVLRYGGIGLKNVRRRLDLMYPGQYELAVNSNSSSFSILLTLQLSVLQGVPLMHKIA